ncbi:MarR family winged helix-turn-helix transcriptional regulator [uncultured Amnibacterium sp.]|uniref:MarR family winged helix-turn-helix transcriptional regulator n=1 Tax=uncultured Amnibacterium sp. TaxID=1631851 RepID=UPI0035CB6769
MTTDDAIRSINESFDRLGAAVRRSAREAAEQLHPGLQPAALPLFREVLREGRMQPHVLATRLGMDKGAVSRHLKELREQGLVQAERDETDARAIWISATPDAVQRAEAGWAIRQSALHTRLASWDPDDLDRFAVLLDRFADPEWLRER